MRDQSLCQIQDGSGGVTVNNPTNSTVANLQPYRFAGGMLDRSTNYVKFGQRYYDPGTGRFTQQDSVEVIGNPGRGNRYQYAGDNPVNSVDASGRDTVCYTGGPESYCTDYADPEQMTGDAESWTQFQEYMDQVCAWGAVLTATGQLEVTPVAAVVCGLVGASDIATKMFG